MTRCAGFVSQHACLLGAAAALLCGCSREVVPVSGRITRDGKPLADAVVTFQPLANQKTGRPVATGSVGRTDAQGRFTLRLIDPNRSGALVGDHVVTIGMGESTDGANSVEELPPMWRDGSKRFKVPERGTSEANFEISGR
jgi:hypothetical protein